MPAPPAAASPPPSRDARRYPEHLREEVERYLERASASPRSRSRRGWTRRCATRCWPAASASARCSRSRPRARVGLEQREVLPLAGRDRADPHLLADPRRPAGDGRRRAAPRAPTCHVKFGEDVAILAGDGALRRGLPPPAHAASARRPSACWRRPRSWPRRPASTAWSAASTPTSARTTPSGPAALRRLHELKTGRLIGASVLCVLLLTGIEDASRDRALPSLRGGAGRAVPDRRRHT